jgi:hypothetical protein
VAFGTPSTVSFDFCSGTTNRSYARKQEEFAADFILVTRRSLSESDYRIFRFYFLLGADWKLCCKRLKMDRGNFFHALYRIEERLGCIFAELEPYALYPTEDYFHGRRYSDPVRPSIPTPEVFEPQLLIQWRKLVA